MRASLRAYMALAAGFSGIILALSALINHRNELDVLAWSVLFLSIGTVINVTRITD